MKNMESAENTKDTELFSNSVPFASSTVRSILNGIVYANPRNTCSVLKFCNKLIRSNLFPFQRSRAGLRDTHVDEITDTVRTSVEHHHTVLLRTTEQLVARTLGNTFHKHLIRFTDATLVGLGRQTVLQSNNLIQPADFHLFGHIIFEMFGSIRSRTFGIFKHESGIVSTFFHQRK